jgi:hypothetical protein
MAVHQLQLAVNVDPFECPAQLLRQFLADVRNRLKLVASDLEDCPGRAEPFQERSRQARTEAGDQMQGQQVAQLRTEFHGFVLV